MGPPEEALCIVSVPLLRGLEVHEHVLRHVKCPLQTRVGVVLQGAFPRCLCPHRAVPLVILLAQVPGFGYLEPRMGRKPLVWHFPKCIP